MNVLYHEREKSSEIKYLAFTDVSQRQIYISVSTDVRKEALWFMCTSAFEYQGFYPNDDFQTFQPLL